MVVRGLVDKPARIDTPLGTLADVGNYFTPKLSRRVLHQLYLGYPDSAAARGVDADQPSAPRPSRRPKRPVSGGRPKCGCRARSSARCAWCPACTGSPYDGGRVTRVPHARLRRRRHRRRRRDGAGLPVRPAPTPSWSASPRPRETFPCEQVCQQQPRPARAVPGRRRSGVEGFRAAAEHAAAHGRGHPRAAGARLRRRCRRRTASSPRTTPRRRGSRRHTPIPAS